MHIWKLLTKHQHRYSTNCQPSKGTCFIIWRTKTSCGIFLIWPWFQYVPSSHDPRHSIPQQSSDHNKRVSGYSRKGPLFHLTPEHESKDRTSGQMDCSISLLGSFPVSWDLRLPPLVQSLNMDGILLGVSESKQYIDPRKPSSAPQCITPRPAGCSRPFSLWLIKKT